jgi:hypothetical protein
MHSMHLIGEHATGHIRPRLSDTALLQVLHIYTGHARAGNRPDMPGTRPEANISL